MPVTKAGIPNGVIPNGTNRLSGNSVQIAQKVLFLREYEKMPPANPRKDDGKQYTNVSNVR